MPIHDIDHILTNKKLAPIYDTFREEHDKFLHSDFNSASKANLTIMWDTK